MEYNSLVEQARMKKTNEKCKEFIEVIKEEYVFLFRKILDFKKESYSEEDSFYDLATKIPLCYPRYSDQIVRLNNVLWDSHASYFEVIRSMLNIYDSMSQGYEEESDYSEDMWDF